MKKYKDPYPECEKCKDLSDCAYPDIEDLGDCFNPLPPNDCPRPMDVMNETRKKYKKERLNGIV